MHTPAKPVLVANMFTGTSLTLTDSEAVGRLLAAGLLDRAKEGLRPTPQWENDMSAALQTHPKGGLQDALQSALQDHFPEAAGEEVDLLARTMLAVEARAAGLK